MSQTSARLLQLLSLLQTPREWPGPELAGRLAVTTRTVRNDVERLRSLGYPVEATRGSIGGYRLAAGTAMPPLLLEDDEAVAVALALRTVAGGAVAGIEETSLRALTKLQQVLPARLAGRVDALQTYTARVTGRSRGQEVDGALLALLAGAAREHERTRFAYSDHTGAATERRVEPYRLVNLGRRWYLVAWDVERGDWRTFRVDRIAQAAGMGHRFRPRPLPAEDIAGYVAERTRQARTRFTARILVHASAEFVAERTAGYSEGSVEAAGPDRCIFHAGGGQVENTAIWLGWLGADFEVLDPPELAYAVRQLGERYTRAAAG